MEIEDLKSIWKNNDKFQPKNETEIASMLNGRSKSIVDKLKRSVWFEIIVTLIAGFGFLAYALNLEGGALKWTIISVLVLFASYTIYYVKKLMLLNRFNPANENLKGNIAHLIQKLTSYLRFYKRSYAILYPIYFFLGLLFGAIERGMDEFLRIVTQSSVSLYLLIFAVGFFVLSYSLTNWYFKKLYGNHLDKLKELLADLESTPAV